MPRTMKHRSELGKFDCVVPDNLPELFADGVTQLQLGIPISRIMFHAVTAPTNGAEDEQVEQRVAKLSLAIPTAALFELVANIASGADAETVTQTNVAVASYSAAVSQQLSRVAALAANVKK